MKTHVFTCFDAACEQYWARAFGSHCSFYASAQWMRSIAGSLAARPAYVIAEESGITCGAMAAYLIGYDTFLYLNPPQLIFGAGWRTLSTYQSEQDRSRSALLTATLVPNLDQAYPCAVCAIPFGYADPLSYHGKQSVDALLCAFDVLARDWGARSSAILYVSRDPTDVLVAASARHGFTAGVIDARGTLPIQFTSMDGYLSGFPGSRRRVLQKEMRALAREAVTTEVVGLDQLDATVESLGGLSSTLMTRYGALTNPGVETAALRKISRYFGELARVVLVKKENRVVAFTLFYEYAETLYMAFCGQDYSVRRAHFLASYYEPLRVALARGFTRIDYGPGALETKVSRGCRLIPLQAFFRFDSLPRAPVLELLALADRAQRKRLSTLGWNDEHSRP